MKWFEFMQSYTFALKHKLGKTNKVVGALSRRVALLGTTTTRSTGLESMKANYEVDRDFVDAWRASKGNCGAKIRLHIWIILSRKDTYSRVINYVF